MSIPGLGDAALIIDLATRAVCFINDLRHAQDDFLGLRSEAECLRICINALNSEDCMQTLFYISVDQGKDLKSIVDGCELNLQDLNTFIAKCASLVAKDALGGQKSTKAPIFSKEWWKKFRKPMAKGFAAIKFVMSDKQAFRDKLMLPTASINVFLTSLTHVGLARMMKMGPKIATPAQPAAVPPNSQLIGWSGMGRRVAFRDAIDADDLMIPGIEEDIIAYALQLIKGRGNVGGTKNGPGKPTKVTKPARKASRSRSRARFVRRNGQMYVFRDKSVSRLPIGVERTDRVERVDREYASDSDSGRSIRMIEAPPDSYDNVRITERRPASASDDSDRERQTRGRRSTANDRASSNVRAELDAEIRNLQRAEEATAAREVHEREERALKEEIRKRKRDQDRARRREMEERVRREKLEAVEEMERIETVQRMSRRAEERQHHMRTEAQSPQVESIVDTMDYLFSEYGVIVEMIPPGSRPPLDSGYVHEPDQELSDEEDAKPIVPPSRTDRLRAETSRRFSSYEDSDPYESGYRRSESRPYQRYSRPRPYSSYSRRYEDSGPTRPIIIEDPGNSSRRRYEHSPDFKPEFELKHRRPGYAYDDDGQESTREVDARYHSTERNKEDLSDRIIIEHDPETHLRPPQGSERSRRHQPEHRRASYSGHDAIVNLQPAPQEPRSRHGSYVDERYRLHRRRTDDGDDDDDDSDDNPRMMEIRRRPR